MSFGGDAIAILIPISSLIVCMDDRQGRGDPTPTLSTQHFMLIASRNFSEKPETV